MKSEAKSRLDGAQAEGNLVEKLNKRVFVGHNDKVGPSTPAHVSFPKFQPSAPHSVVSARKLAASLWEFHQYHGLSPPFAEMHRGAHGTAGPSRRRQRHGQQRSQGFRDTGLDLSRFLPDHTPDSPDRQPDSVGSLRRHIALSLRQHHRAIERSNHALQPVSPASYGSSLEVGPYNPAATPGSSIELRGRPGDPHCNLKTSTELLKVLNRIWTLEEQHASNISLTRALKTELLHARVKIKELLREQQADRNEIDDLMKQMAEDKLARKTKEHDRVHTAIQSVREELEDERKLRKRSESLHRKLARDLSEAKSTLSSAVKELENERKSRRLLENLCDEFAKGIKSYEQEVRVFKQRSEKDHWTQTDDSNRLILHISESWLDERTQMKIDEAESGFQKASIVDKLWFEIETFLQARRTGNPRHRRNSLESVPLNDAISAPRDGGDEEDSEGSDTNCFELKKPGHHSKSNPCGDDDVGKIDRPNTETLPVDKTKCRTPSSLQVKFEEKMAHAVSSNGHTAPPEADHAQISISQRSRHSEITEEVSHAKNNNVNHSETQVVNSNQAMDTIIRNHIVLSESGDLHENERGEASCSYSARRDHQASPIRRWNSKTVTPDLEMSESCTKPVPLIKENTLKAKLNEARSKGQRSRLRLFRGSS